MEEQLKKPIVRIKMYKKKCIITVYNEIEGYYRESIFMSINNPIYDDKRNVYGS